jgi:hypothetical protein
VRYVCHVGLHCLWLKSKLGDVSHFSGHFLNVDYCGYQSFLGPFGKENSTYISYEKQPDDTTRVVHNTLVHMHDTCGGDNTRLQNTSIKNDAYLAHLRFENLFLRQFATYLDTDKIQSLYEEACYRK